MSNDGKPVTTDEISDHDAAARRLAEELEVGRLDDLFGDDPMEVEIVEGERATRLVIRMRYGRMRHMTISSRESPGFTIPGVRLHCRKCGTDLWMAPQDADWVPTQKEWESRPLYAEDGPMCPFCTMTRGGNYPLAREAGVPSDRIRRTPVLDPDTAARLEDLRTALSDADWAAVRRLKEEWQRDLAELDEEGGPSPLNLSQVFSLGIALGAAGISDLAAAEGWTALSDILDYAD